MLSPAASHKPASLASACHYNRGWSYNIPHTRHKCCAANSVGWDPSGWYSANIISVTREATNHAVVSFSLQSRDVFEDRWRTLAWRDLATMHGRRVHVSAVSEGLDRAWHLHVSEASVPASATVFSVRLTVPRAALRLRLLFNYGVVADNVNLCVDEKASHVDPAPGGQELLVEGHAL